MLQNGLIVLNIDDYSRFACRNGHFTEIFRFLGFMVLTLKLHKTVKMAKMDILHDSAELQHSGQ